MVTEAGDWLTDGVRLLESAKEHCGPLRLVVPTPEKPRLEARLRVGLLPVEHWWHRDLPGGEAAGHGDPDAQVVVDGATGLLVPAPPIYQPGGPVLLVTDVDSPVSLRRIEAGAAARGATVSVVTQDPRDTDLAMLLTDAGYVLTTAFCERR